MILLLLFPKNSHIYQMKEHTCFGEFGSCTLLVGWDDSLGDGCWCWTAILLSSSVALDLRRTTRLLLVEDLEDKAFPLLVFFLVNGWAVEPCPVRMAILEAIVAASVDAPRLLELWASEADAVVCLIFRWRPCPCLAAIPVMGWEL